jgi:hypothetical protein
MTVFGGIDLYSNNSVISLIDTQNRVISRDHLINEQKAKGVVSKKKAKGVGDKSFSLSFSFVTDPFNCPLTAAGRG